MCQKDTVEGIEFKPKYNDDRCIGTRKMERKNYGEIR